MFANITLATVVCEVSTDAGVTWQLMSAGAVNGQYNIIGLTGLATGTVTPIEVRLTVNGNVMQTAAPANPTLSFTAP
ncbi:MAG: hypothetical protein Q9N02_08500 [Ghiorsea sp.]|nr:hypothetical protein [Ghiorsea sp.]